MLSARYMRDVSVLGKHLEFSHRWGRFPVVEGSESSTYPGVH